MTVKPGGLVFRVFEGSDCQLNYVFGPPCSTDSIVWGTVLPYQLRVYPKSIAELITAKIARRKREGGT